MSEYYSYSLKTCLHKLCHGNLSNINWMDLLNTFTEHFYSEFS